MKYTKIEQMAHEMSLTLTTKLFLGSLRASRAIKNVLKIEVEGREFAKILRSLEQFIQTVKGQNNFRLKSFDIIFGYGILLPTVRKKNFSDLKKHSRLKAENLLKF